MFLQQGALVVPGVTTHARRGATRSRRAPMTRMGSGVGELNLTRFRSLRDARTGNQQTRPNRVCRERTGCSIRSAAGRSPVYPQ